MSDAPTTLNHKSADFTPLDHSQLNDFRRKIVNNEDVTDEELQHSIQTFLYFDRQLQMQGATKTRKTSGSKKEPIDPDLNFDDLLNTPVDPSKK